MNSDEAKWLKELFDQHKADQQLYLDSKFENIATKIKEVKESVDDLQEDIEDVEVTCLALLDDVEESTNKKIVVGSVGAIALSLLLWTAFGTNALSVVLKWLAGVPLP